MAPGSPRLADGARVPDLAGIAGGFAVAVAGEDRSVFTVNVRAERLVDVVRSLVRGIDGVGYFLLETGTDHEVEEQLRQQPADPFHKDVFYLDGIDAGRARELRAEHERIRPLLDLGDIHVCSKPADAAWDQVRVAEPAVSRTAR